MARFFFVVPPITSHAAPLIAMAQALVRRGHDCAVAGHEFSAGPLVGPDTQLLIRLPEQPAREIAQRLPAVTLRVGGQFLCWRDVFHPLGECMRQDVLAAAWEFRPDVLVVDQITAAGFYAAGELGIPWVVVAGSMLPLSSGETWTAGGQKTDQLSLSGQLAQFRTKPELTNSLRIILETRPTRTLVLSLREFVPAYDPPSHVRFVGPILRPYDATSAPLSTSGAPLIYVGLGNILSEVSGGFYGAVAEALGDLPVRVVVSAPDRFAQTYPDNFAVRPFWPQREVLHSATAVICHGGFNTVCEALAVGLPLICAPGGGDTDLVARQVEACGAGLRTPLRRPQPDVIRTAVLRVLHERSFRDAALRLSAVLSHVDPLGASVHALEELI